MSGLIQQDESAAPRIPNLELAHHKFTLEAGDPSAHEETYNILLKEIKEKSMAPFYKNLSDTVPIFSKRFDSELYKQMVEENATKLEALDAKIKDAEENLGETEISDALEEKLRFFAGILDKENALKAYEVAFDKTATLGTKIDIVFTILRLGLFVQDDSLIRKSIERAKGLIEQGGDWDRRNRLRVYEGYYLLTQRGFEKACNLFLDTLSTFTSTELMPYPKFISYVILISMLVLKRPDVKSKVMEAPEVLEVVHELPMLSRFMDSLYRGEYESFFSSLASVEGLLKADRAFHLHARYYVSEMRIRSYIQMLQSYRSVTMESMARQFGVSEEFLDNDLSRFIAAGRLNCVIDKEGRVVETNRPDSKNSQYQSCIKHGDLLLNRIQRLSRVINI